MAGLLAIRDNAITFYHSDHMLRNYLTIAIRNLIRHKTFSLLTILGLGIGMAACFVLVQYALFEQRYDDFNKNEKNIFRLGLTVYNDGVLQTQIPKNFSALGPALKSNLPEVKAYVRVFPIDGTMAIKRNDVIFNEKNILFADASILEAFTFPVLQGDHINALADPYTVVITKSTAKRYFNNEDPIGKLITVREGSVNVPLVVKAVVEDVPENSHITFDFLISHSTLKALWGERADRSWDEALFYTYILLEPSTDQQLFMRKLTPEWLAKYSNWKPPVKLDFIIQPLGEIYLHSNMVQEAKVNGNARQVMFMWIIAGLIVLLAWINYINLSTARYLERAKEVGVRKVIGANRSHLLTQFILESMVLNALSICVAFMIVQITLPVLNAFTRKTIPVWNDLYAIAALLSFFISGSVLSAFFPSLVLSSFDAVSVLKGKFTSSFKGLFLRKSLVVYQFVVSMALLGGTFVVYLQLRYMRNAELGTDISQTLVLSAPDITDSTTSSKISFLKNELTSHPEIKYVVTSTSIPGKTDNIIQGGLSRFEKSDEPGVNHYNFGVDRNFIPAFKIKLLAGRNFSPVADEQSVVINRTAVSVLGFERPEDAIGHRIATNWTPERTIVGVVEDFHQQSLRSAVDPVVFSLDESGSWGYYSIKLDLSGSGKNLDEVVSMIHDKWSATFAGNPFDYFFLDDYFNEQYKDDFRFGKVLNVFSFIMLLIACLGIFGLSIFNAAQRTKEIGIRKVLGASISNILLLLSGDYLKLILIASLLASPLTYYFTQEWLKGYVYHISLQWWMLAVPGLIVLCVAVLAISSQSIKAALTNPTESLNS